MTATRDNDEPIDARQILRDCYPVVAELEDATAALVTECRRILAQRLVGGASQSWCAGCRRPNFGLGLSFVAAVDRAESLAGKKETTT
jgi:hypothetical protein